MRWRRYISMLAAALAWLVLAGSASAAEPNTIREVTIPRGLERVAEEYWSARAVTLPLPVVVYATGGNEGGAGFAQEPGNAVWIAEGVLAGRGTFEREYLCVTYLHERGHNAGLSHESGWPIMRPTGFSSVPPRCVRWAAR